MDWGWPSQFFSATQWLSKISLLMYRFCVRSVVPLSSSANLWHHFATCCTKSNCLSDPPPAVSLLGCGCCWQQCLVADLSRLYTKPTQLSGNFCLRWLTVSLSFSSAAQNRTYSNFPQLEHSVYWYFSIWRSQSQVKGGTNLVPLTSSGPTSSYVFPQLGAELMPVSVSTSCVPVIRHP